MICLSQNETGRETDMRLLFAEDERSLSRAVTAILKKNNYSVDAVYDGQEALDYLVSILFDIPSCTAVQQVVDSLDVRLG